MKIALWFGTETGNAEMLCEDIEAELSGDHDVTLKDLSQASAAEMDPSVFYIFVTSTYGNGDLPTTAAPFCDALAADTPDLSGIRFAMFGLGDTVFAETFNNGSKVLAETLIKCKAQMIGERGLFDASSAELPEDVAMPWVESVINDVASVAA
ncbi:MAG: flavodoxin domain-containing protein [Rhodobacteraceae bacterium]|nr:flavodoxin domain-containing protein [Paracoccaceae bacterium]